MLRNITLLLAAGIALAPAAAKAESITYLKDGDIWRAAVDGSNAQRLTTGGGSVTIKLPAKHARAVRKLGRKSRALTVAVTAAGVTRTAVVAPR